MIDVLQAGETHTAYHTVRIAIVQQEALNQGMTVSLVARQHGVAASQLFLWRKQYRKEVLLLSPAGEQDSPASELLPAMKQIKELQRLLARNNGK